MSATKWQAQGTILYIGDAGSPEQFFAVDHQQDFTLPQLKADQLDVTCQDESTHYYDWLSTLIDGGEISFPIVFDPTCITHNETATVAGTNAGGLKYLIENRLKRNMRIQLPTTPGTRFRFLGTVSGFAGDAKVKGSLMTTVKVKVSGKPTLETGTGSGA